MCGSSMKIVSSRNNLALCQSYGTITECNARYVIYNDRWQYLVLYYSVHEIRIDDKNHQCLIDLVTTWHNDIVHRWNGGISYYWFPFVVWHWSFYLYPTGLFHWHRDNNTIALAPMRQLWRIWLNIPPQIARFMRPIRDHLGPTGPRWAPCWPHGPCYQGRNSTIDTIALATIRQLCQMWLNYATWMNLGRYKIEPEHNKPIKANTCFLGHTVIHIYTLYIYYFYYNKCQRACVMD